MNTDAKVFRNSSLTLGAELRCILGWDFNYQTTSLFRFAPEYIEEPKPGYISHRPVESMIIIPGAHLLNENGVIVPKQLVGNLKMKISSLVIDLLVNLGNQYPCFVSSVRTFNSARKSSLPHSEYILRLFEEARIFNLHTFRSSKKGLATDIYANTPIDLRQRLGRHIVAGEACIPLACRRLADGNSFNISFNRAGQSELESPDIPDGEILVVKFPTTLVECETVVSISTPKSRKACFISISDSSEKALICPVKSFDYILESLSIYFFVFEKFFLEFWKLLNLVKAAYKAFVLPVGSNTLLKSCIVELTAKVKPMVSFTEYLLICLKTVFEGLLHLPSTIYSISYSK